MTLVCRKDWEFYRAGSAIQVGKGLAALRRNGRRRQFRLHWQMPGTTIQAPFSMLSVNCDSYKVAIIWAIIAHEFDDKLNRKISS